MQYLDYNEDHGVTEPLRHRNVKKSSVATVFDLQSLRGPFWLTFLRKARVGVPGLELCANLRWALT